MDVVIYSINKIRGGITQKILERSSIKSILTSRIYELKDAILKYKPNLLVIDSKDTIKNEINLVNQMVIEMGINKVLWLSDPFVPEMIISEVKELLSQEEPANNDSMYENLKQFLNL
ncbi:MAG: hypothetical protein HQK79_11390 [Desulfobacterales bacterium]|nr:hypothetical protein [Desulfobacterales bacterium]